MAKEKLDKPNLVVLMCDQLRPDFLSGYGASFIETPHIDSLADEGIIYQNAVSPSPLCVPARASFLTGENSLVTGILSNGAWLRPDHNNCGMPTWPELLSVAGYHSEGIGKMHFYPWDASEGFDHRVIAEDKRHIFIQDDYAHYLKEHGLQKYHGKDHAGYFENKGAVISLIPAEHQVDRWTADRTIEFIGTYDNEKPFAVMTGFPGPHCPYDPPEEYARLFQAENMPASLPENIEEHQFFKDKMITACKAEWNQVDYTDFQENHKKKIRAHYAGLVKQIDDQVGRIIAALKARELWNNTVVIFTSDHGDFLGDFGLIGKKWFYESSVRIPIILRIPGWEVAKVESLTSLTDLYSAILFLAGLYGQKPDSCLPGGLGVSSDPRKTVCGALKNGFWIRTDRWKLCQYAGNRRHLFDLQKNEQINLVDRPEFREVQSSLEALLNEWILASMNRAHREKEVHGDGHSHPSPFCEPGWKRPYPYQSP